MNENVRKLLQGFSQERRKKNRPKSLLSRASQILIDLLLFIIVILTFSIYIPFITLPQLECFAGNQLFRFLLTGLSTILLLHYLVLRGWKLKILPLITFAVLAGELIRDIPITENSFDVEFSKPYRVMTFNLNNYQLSKLSLDKKTDLICLQEVQLSDVNENLKNSSKKKWADYSWYFGSDFENIRSGLLVLSKQPITLVKRIECPSNQIDKGRYYYILKTKWNEKDIYIIPLHLESVDTQNGLTGLTKSWKIRLAQARIIASEIERIKEPLIVMGDFNTTPTDRIFKIICNQLTDTWIETGKSLGTTWHSHVPLFRIDYILYRNFQAAANGKVSFFRHSSDHMAYKVDLF